MFKQNDLRYITLLSVIAGIVYSSWPLGFVLNPVVLHHGLASELADNGQPYNWLFIYGDVLCGLLMLVVAWHLRHDIKRPHFAWQHKVSLGGIEFFCIMAALAALSSSNCVAAVKRCPTFGSDPLTLLHSITSVLAALGLFVAFASLSYKLGQNLLVKIEIILFFILGWWTFFTLFTPGKGVFVQNIFITLCSFCLATYPYNFINTLAFKINSGR